MATQEGEKSTGYRMFAINDIYIILVTSQKRCSGRACAMKVRVAKRAWALHGVLVHLLLLALRFTQPQTDAGVLLRWVRVDVHRRQ